MIKKGLKILFLYFVLIYTSSGQVFQLKDYDVYINDTLICRSEFYENIASIDSLRLATMVLKPRTDGFKTYYYLNGKKHSQGCIKNNTENGYWVFYYSNGQNASAGHFLNGKREGVFLYWYSNGNFKSMGHFKKDKYHGKWQNNKEDGSIDSEQMYRNGVLVKVR
jgi:antitoxin component YwqK of YwqJK toxin-antitoxin module